MANVVDAVMPGVFKVVNGEKLKLTPKPTTIDE